MWYDVYRGTPEGIKLLIQSEDLKLYFNMIEENTVATDAVETPAETTPEVVEAPKEETVGEALAVPEAPAPKEDTVSLAKFMKEKKARQELEAQIEELSKAPRTTKQVSTDLKALAEEHNVDIDFLEKLSETLEARNEAKIEANLKPLRDKERQEKIETAFSTAFDRAMASMPEYAQVVNRNVIKTLSLDPANVNKTFTQIIEDTYGNAIGGKKTTERATPRAGSISGELDYARAKSDNDYFKEVMADPVLKKQYNDKLFQEA